jgi:hypothetical protein
MENVIATLPQREVFGIVSMLMRGVVKRVFVSEVGQLFSKHKQQREKEVRRIEFGFTIIMK